MRMTDYTAGEAICQVLFWKKCKIMMGFSEVTALRILEIGDNLYPDN